MNTIKSLWTNHSKPLAVLLILLDFLWEFPQNLLGFFVALFTRFKTSNRSTIKDGTVKVFTWSSNSGLSLGWFQFVNENASQLTVSHEVGHSYQSLYLGWTYLLIIGIPSLLWAGIFYKRSGKSYYWFYTESWADRLGGISIR